MPDKIAILWEKLRTSIWPVPVAMICFAVMLREITSLADAAIDDQLAISIWWLSSGTGDDARNLLSTIVPALITMASIMFSITMVVLSLAASQFGSRLVRTYMTDIRTKLALGIFLMTIVYCLLVLRTISSDMPPADVPHVGVTLGLALSLACVLTLVLFLNVIARSMVADEVIRRVAAELEDTIEALPDLEGGSADGEDQDRALGNLNHAAILRSADEGYVQAIRYDGLAALAREYDVTLQLHCKAGAFMCRDGWLLAVHPAERMNAALGRSVQNHVQIGQRRTPTQDLEFPIRHLVDIALRALSPGINDPNTAIVVIDRLRAALSRLMCKQMPKTVCRDSEGMARVFGIDTGYGDIFDEAFNQIRQAGAVQPSVIIHMLAAIERIAEHVRTPEQCDSLLRHLDLIARAGLRNTEEESDQADIERKQASAHDKLKIALSTASPNQMAAAPSS